jgi:hypothetical protein
MSCVSITSPLFFPRTALGHPHTQKHSQCILSVALQLNSSYKELQIVINLCLPVKFVQTVDLNNDIYNGYCLSRDFDSDASK